MQTPQTPPTSPGFPSERPLSALGLWSLRRVWTGLLPNWPPWHLPRATAGPTDTQTGRSHLWGPVGSVLSTPSSTGGSFFTSVGGRFPG